MLKNVHIRLPTPYASILIYCDNTLDLCDVHTMLYERLPTNLIDACFLEGTLSCSEVSYLQLRPRLLGGKGGFGAQLRSAGGRMRRGQKANKDSMKDVSGRRVRTLKRAQALAEALRDAPEKEQKARAEERARLVAILAQEMPGRKIKFDDEDYLTQSEAIIDDIRAAMEEVYEQEESDVDEEQEGSSSFLDALKTGYEESTKNEAQKAESSDEQSTGVEDPAEGSSKRKRQRVE